MSIIIAQETKVCTKCGVEYPATADYFYIRNDRGKLRNGCRACLIATNLRRRKNDPEKAQRIASQYYYSHQERELQKKRADYAAHPERYAAYRKLYVEKYPGRENELRRKRYSANPQRILAYSHKRTAQIRALPASLTTDEWENILAEFNYSCAYCGKAWFEIKGVLEQEHVVPVAQGGGYTADNIVPACRGCNAHKKHRTPEQAGMPILRPRA